MIAFKKIKFVSLAMAASLPVLYFGFGAEAVRFTERQFAQYVGRCASDVGFYERHMRWCEGIYRVTYHKAPRHARAEVQETVYGPAATGERVTVTRDHQASGESGPTDQFIALQTAADVQRMPFFGLAVGGFPGAINLGGNTLSSPQVPQARAERPRLGTPHYANKA